MSRNELRGSIATLEQLGLIRPAEPASTSICRDCDGGRAHSVEFIRDRQSGSMHGYIHCSHCGLTEVDPRELDRWRIDPLALLRAVMAKLTPAPREPTELIPGRLWNAGKVHLLGQLREVFFVTGYRTATGSAVVDFLRTRTKCIVLMPSEIGVARWGVASNNLLLAIESVATLEDSGIALDQQLLETRVAAFFGSKKPKTPPKRRSSRLAGLDALERELAEHLRAARDHAITSRDFSGEAKLLKRPTKDQLARRAKVSASAATRCFKDEAGAKLRMMWELAIDLDAIIGYRED
jgi:hypothetical protein